MGLLQLLSGFDDMSFPISVFDADGLARNGKSFARIEKELIARASPKNRLLIVGITTNDANLPEALHLARLLKTKRPGCRIVLGGPGVYFDSQKLLDVFPESIDIIVRGEGSLVFPEIVSSLVAGDRALLAKKIIHAPRSGEMDDLPFPRYERLEMRPYIGNDSTGTRLPIFAGAGCAHTCRYCSTSNFWGHRARYKAIDRLLREIDALVRLGCRKVEFVHDNFFSDMDFVASLAESMIRGGVVVDWACSGRIDDFDLSVLPTVMHSGCRRIFWGIESGSAKALEIMDKKLDLVDSKKKLFRILGEEGLHSAVSFVYNHPGDSREMFEETLTLAVEIRSRFPNNTTLSLNNYLNLSGTAFGRGSFRPSQFLLGKIDFDRGFVEKNPERFPFFMTSDDVTGLSEGFRFEKLNPLLDSYPKTIHFLAAKQGCGALFQRLDGVVDVGACLHKLVDQQELGNVGRDLLAFETASHVGGSVQVGRQKLLETRIDVGRYPETVEEKRSFYLFSASGGRVDAYEITEEHHREFRNFQMNKLYDGAVVSEILQGLGSSEDC